MSSFRQLKEQRDARSLSSPYFAAPSAPQQDYHAPAFREEERVASSLSSPLNQNAAKQIPLPLQVCSKSNPELQVRMTAGKGRGLFWCPGDGRRAGRGTTLLRIQPDVTVPSSESMETMCHMCFNPSREGKALQRCSGCKTLRYCSTTCQKNDWPAHRQECKALQEFARIGKAKNGKNSRQNEPGMIVRLMGRLVWERKRLGENWWKRIENLQSNREAIVLDEKLVDLPMKLAAYLGTHESQTGKDRMNELGFNSASEVLDLIGRTTSNTFVTYSSDLTAVGIALSTSIAMINHSCAPNVAVVYPNGPGAKQPMHVVAIKDLNPEEELTTMYVEVSDPYHLRQKTLSQRYSFKCSCSLCNRSERALQGKKARVDAREALWCGRAGCSGWVSAPRDDEQTLSSVCTVCKLESNLDVLEITEALRSGREMLDKVDQLMSQGDMKEALDSAQSTMKILTQIQPPSAYPLLSLLRQLQTALILCATSTNDQREATQLFEEAIRFHLVSLAGMQASNGGVFCEGHPSRAIALATLSTLLVREAPTTEEADWVSNYTFSPFLTKVPLIPTLGRARDQAGITLMIQAIKELKIAYGNDEEGGEPGRKLISQVREWQENEAVMSISRLPPRREG